MVKKLDLDDFLAARQKTPPARSQPMSQPTTTRAQGALSRVTSGQRGSTKLSRPLSSTSNASTQHRFSRRPMLNKLMNAIASNAHLRDEKLKEKRSNMQFSQLSEEQNLTQIAFMYRQLGVNAKANNYAFAEDCYSQTT